jgi:hypothetical protein
MVFVAAGEEGLGGAYPRRLLRGALEVHQQMFPALLLLRVLVPLGQLILVAAARRVLPGAAQEAQAPTKQEAVAAEEVAPPWGETVEQEPRPEAVEAEEAEPTTPATAELAVLAETHKSRFGCSDNGY